MRNGQEYYNEIIKNFGSEILDDNSNINRKKLAHLVFYDDAKRNKLNDITYRFVVPKIKEEIEKNSNDKVVVIDVPLLFESGLDKICDITIGVIADKEICIDRIMKRDGLCKDEAISRINVQKENIFFKINCNYCVYNENTESLQAQVEEILNR